MCSNLRKLPTFFCFSFSNAHSNCPSNLDAIVTRVWLASIAVTESPRPKDRKRVRWPWLGQRCSFGCYKHGYMKPNLMTIVIKVRSWMCYAYVLKCCCNVKKNNKKTPHSTPQHNKLLKPVSDTCPEPTSTTLLQSAWSQSCFTSYENIKKNTQNPVNRKADVLQQPPPPISTHTTPSFRISCCFLGLTCFLKMCPSRELWLWFSRNSSGFSDPNALCPSVLLCLGNARAWAVARNAKRDRGHTEGYL